MNKKAAPAENQSLTVNDRQIPVQIHYEPRGNSRVSITKKGVVLRISRYLSNIDKSRQVEDFKRWALKKLLQRPELCAPVRKDFYSGKIIAVRDKSFMMDLKFTDSRNCTARLKGNLITIHLSTLLTEEQLEKAINYLVSKCIANELYPWVNERLRYLNQCYFPQKKFKTLRLKYASSLWGSCSHAGNISISTRLLLAPDSVIDYVLVHELAHLLVPDHSQKFWDVIAKVLPDFEISEQWLKENGTRCDY